MGFALANVAIELGAEVILISGPSEEKISHPSISIIKVLSAEKMFEKVKKYYSNVDIVIAAAAVSDFKPKNYKAQKIKKNQNIQSIELSPTKDILAYMGEKKKDQYLVGFALETENEIDNAKLKLKIKNLDGIVLNSLNDKGAGFSSPTNKITFIHNDNIIKTFPLQSKTECAKRIFEQILNT
jgi:phosphopantothenoylcysteine decarboxylase/phosphopantothenate--cysteine ligase